MSSGNEKSNIGLGPSYTGTPLSENFSTDALIQSINDGAQGGQKTADFFDKINTFGQMLHDAVKNGMSAWTESTDAHDLPIYYMGVDDGNGDMFYIKIHMMGLKLDGDGDNRTVVTNGTQQKFNDKTYDGIGYKAFTFSYKGTTYAQWVWWVGITAGSTALFTAAAPVLKATIKSIASQFTSKLSRVGGISSADGVEMETIVETAEAEAEATIAEDAAVEVGAEVVASEIAVSTLGFIGIGLAVAAACVVLAVILHNSHQQVRLVNLSRYKVLWSVYFDEGGFIQCPGKVDKDGHTTENYAIDAVKRTGPPDDKNPSPKVHYGDFSVDSLSDLHGLGYAMQLKFVDKDLKEPKDSDVKYKCTLMFDVPFAGDNSTSVTFDDITDLKQYYKDNEGVNKSTRQSASSSDGVITVVTTYDYLSGEHNVPNQSSNGYYYQSLIKISDSKLSA